jgi:radical SAM protein with 4Fe4S-binding SPASM domain
MEDLRKSLKKITPVPIWDLVKTVYLEVKEVQYRAFGRPAMMSKRKKYSLRDIETSRRNLRANFTAYHLMFFRIYFVRRFLQKYEYWNRRFCTVNIETTGFCNRKCFFCFNHDRFPKRERGIMREETYKKIIDELAELKFCGRLSYAFYGEPLLDKRLPAFIEYARRRLPLCFIDIHTNGDVLDEELLITLVQNGVDHFLITNYDDDEKPLLESLSRKYPSHVTFRSYRDFGKTDRAGEIFKRGNTVQAPCLRPSSVLVVNWKGNVLLCCQDFYQSCSFGNVKGKGLWEIWNDKQFAYYRKELRSGNRQATKICKHCDDGGGVPW